MAGYTSEFFLADEHGGLHSGGMGNIEKVGHLGITKLRHVVVPIDIVLVRTLSAEHGGMSRQGDTTIDRLRGERICRGCKQG